MRLIGCLRDIFELLLRDKDFVIRKEHVRIFTPRFQLGILRMVPNRLPKEALLLGETGRAFAFSNGLFGHQASSHASLSKSKLTRQLPPSILVILACPFSSSVPEVSDPSGSFAR